LQLDARNSWANHFPIKYTYLLEEVSVFLLLQTEYSLVVQAYPGEDQPSRRFKKFARANAIAATANGTQLKGFNEAHEAAKKLAASLHEPRGDPEQDAIRLARGTPDDWKR
jgi:hypothetical protein